MYTWVCGGEEGGERTRVSEKEWTKSGRSTWLCSTQKDRIQWAELRCILTSPTVSTGWCRNVYRSHGTGEARKERGAEGRGWGARRTLGENAKRKDKSRRGCWGVCTQLRVSWLSMPVPAPAGRQTAGGGPGVCSVAPVTCVLHGVTASERGYAWLWTQRFWYQKWFHRDTHSLPTWCLWEHRLSLNQHHFLISVIVSNELYLEVLLSIFSISEGLFNWHLCKIRSYIQLPSPKDRWQYYLHVRMLLLSLICGVFPPPSGLSWNSITLLYPSDVYIPLSPQFYYSA